MPTRAANAPQAQCHRQCRRDQGQRGVAPDADDHAGSSGAEARRQPHDEVLGPVHAGAVVLGDGRREQGGTGDQRCGPTESEQEEHSGFQAASTGGGGGGQPGSGSGGSTSNGAYSAGDQEATPGDDGTYLRGAQVADANGIVQFTTIYPGWYRGRTVHIHLRVHIDKVTVLTTQLYLDESVNTEAFAASPYNEHTGRDTFNDSDNIYDASGLLAAAKSGGLPGCRQPRCRRLTVGSAERA